MLSDLRHRRLAILASSAALAVAAGCGSATKNGAGSAGKDGQAAKAFPASTLAFVDADTDTSSAAWGKLLTVLRRFPSWPKAEAKLQADLAKPATHGAASGASFAKDVEPWLGSEAAVGVVGVQIAANPKPTVLGYAASKDDGKAKDFVTGIVKATAAGSYKGYDEFKRSDQKDTMFAAVGKGVVLVATDEATLKQGIDTREGGDALADSADYKATLDKLSGDNAAVLYVNGKEVGQLLQLALASGAAKSAGAAAGMLGQSQAQLASLRGLGVAVGADDNGFRVRAVALGDGNAAKVSTVASALRAAVPGDAFAYGAVGASDAFTKALTGGTAGAQQQQLLQGLQAQTGLDLATDLPALFGGGLAFYVAPGTPVRGGIVLHPSDAAKAADVMHKITAAVAKFAPAVKFTPIAGGTGEEATVSGVHVAWQKTGETFTVTVEPGAGSSGGTTGGFDANEAYKRLIGEVGGADNASGELFVDVQKIVDAATTAGATISPEARSNLSHVGGVAAVTKTDGDAQTMDALVEVR